jgi:DNA mismatch endonuclease (patch repair protein)
MSRIRSKNTQPEIKVRKYLFSKGFRYRVNYPLLFKPDIVFPKKKFAIFINGCFWHRHGCKNSVMPKTNTEFWENKLRVNIERDKKAKEYLSANNWKIEILWECELENNFENIIQKLIERIK